MRTAILLALILAAIASPSFAAHTITQAFNGECPPDNQFEVRCWDLRGSLYVSGSVYSGETHTYNIPGTVDTLVCIVSCNGKEVYRKRYEFPGTKWRAPPGYPYDITREGDLPAGTEIDDSTTTNLRDCGDCGNGNVDVGEKCDGSKGCTDPLKPTCYECTYCGCNDAKQCVQITGPLQCGTYGCAAYERPSFGVKCLEGICVNPLSCKMDPECISKYQGEPEKKVESVKQGYYIDRDSRIDAAGMGYALLGERYQGEPPKIPVDDFGGTMAISSAPVSAGGGHGGVGPETFKLNGIPYEVEAKNVSDAATIMVNGEEYELGVNESAALDWQATLEVNAIEGGTAYLYLSTITADDLRIMLYTGDYDAETGELSWPPAGRGDGWYPPQEGPILPPFGLQPGEKTHWACTSNFVCALERGEGLDECEYGDGPSEQCKKINETGRHNECKYGSCVVVPGNGTDQCKKHEDCKAPEVPADNASGGGTAAPEDADGRHGACSSAGYCIYAEGEGPDACRSDSDCGGAAMPGAASDGMHTACKDKRCIYVSGEGQDECQGHWQCDSSYPLPATRQMRCFGTMCRMEAADAPGQGRICRTDSDCGGKGLFSSLMGAELEKDARMEPPLSTLLGDERVNLYAGNETAHVILLNGTVVDAGDGEAEGNTVNVRTDMATIEAIEAGNITVMQAFRQDRIIIEGEGLSWLKFAIMNLLYDLGLMSDAG